MTRMLGVIGVGAIVALAIPTAVHAQGSGAPNGTGLPLVITISGTGTVQADDSEKDNGKVDTVTSKTATKKFSTADIIQTVEDNNGAIPTKNAQLVYDNGDVMVIDGNNTYDASGFVTITLDPNGHSVWSGTDSTDDNSGDESQKYAGSYVFTFVFDKGDGLVVTVGGLAKESYSIGKPNKNGDQPASDTISVKFVGDVVSSDGMSGSVTGTLKASGKGTF
jgi:hypothetical protein